MLTRMEKFEAYKLLTGKLDVELKENFGFPFTSVNGNMFSFLSKENVLGIRLAQNEREEFLGKFDSEIYQRPGGQVLKEYVVIPDDLLANADELTSWFEKSLNYAGGLKPKKKKK